MHKQIQLHAEMGTQVLTHLKQLCDTFSPQDLFGQVAGESQAEVFVAGQAVASAVSQLYGDGSCVVYNDIDAFIISKSLREGQKNSRMKLATLEFEAIEAIESDYGGLAAAATSIYEVHSTNRAGMVNTVLARPMVNFQARQQLRSVQFLKSFDLNCVQVAVRLSDGKLVWTPDFELFTQSRQLLVANPKTPLHTAVRYLRKKRELAGCYGNDEQTMELLTAAELRARGHRAQETTKAYQRTLDAQLSMGNVYAEKARQLGSDLGRWFNLECTDEGRVKLYTLRSRSTPDSRLLDDNIEPMLLPTYARALHGHWKKHICDSVLKGLGHEHRRYHYMAVALGQELAVDTQQKKRDVQLMDRHLREHSRLAFWLVLLPLECHGALAQALRDAASRHGQWAYGVFETQVPDEPEMAQMREHPQQAYALLTQWVDGTIERFRREEQDIKKPHRFIVPQVEYAGYSIRELATFQDLAEEGVRQCHCVAGYVGVVRAGEDHIISLRRNRSEDSITLHIRAVSGQGLRVSEVRGHKNRYATEEESALAERLVRSAALYASLARIGVRLTAAKFEAVLSNDRLLARVAKAKQVQAGTHAALRRLLARNGLSYELKRAVIKLRGLPRFAQLAFFDRQGKRHTHFMGSAPWSVILNYVLWGDFRDSSPDVYAGDLNTADDIPF